MVKARAKSKTSKKVTATKKAAAVSKSSKKVAKKKAAKTVRAVKAKKVKKASSKAKKVNNGVPQAYQGYTLSEYQKYLKAKEKYSVMNNEKLKAYLKVNLQSRSGNKDVLITKCSDGETLGATPKCTTCGGGFLRFDQSNGTYKCPGYRDDEDYVNCSAKFSKNEIDRSSWQEPS